jgi:hypothetical protein
MLHPLYPQCNSIALSWVVIMCDDGVYYCRKRSMMVDKTRVAHAIKLERGIPCLRVNRFGLSPVRISNLKAIAASSGMRSRYGQVNSSGYRCRLTSHLETEEVPTKQLVVFASSGSNRRGAASSYSPPSVFSFHSVRHIVQLYVRAHRLPEPD